MRRLIVLSKCIVGGVLLVVGIVLVPLPGPGTPLILLGIGVLATEFPWAKRLQERLTGLAKRVWRRTADTAVAPP